MMESVIRAGLLLVLASVAIAKMEYTADFVKSNPEYQNLVNKGAKSFPYDLINPETKIRVNRFSRLCRNPNEKFELRFYVSSAKIDEHESGASSSTQPLQGIKNCNGKPGIRLTDTFRCPLPQSCSKTFCFTTMEINVMTHPGRSPYMRATMVFENTAKTKSVKVTMQILKPPKNQTDKDHADANQVPHVESPIPSEYFDTELGGTKLREKSGLQYFVNDLSWLNEILRRAKFEKYEDNVLKIADWYMAGPVIIAEEPYTNIMRLEKAFGE